MNSMRSWCGVAMGTVLWVATAWGADQPQWGQRYTRNQVSEEKNLPGSFDPKTGKNIKWTAKLGTETHATPTLGGGRVFIGTNNGESRDPKHKGDRGVLFCLDEKDGRLLWQIVVPKLRSLTPGGQYDPYLDWPNGGIVSPVTIDGEQGYTVTNRGEVICVDVRGMANGNDGPFTDEAAHMTPDGSEKLELGELDGDIVWLFDLKSGAGIYPHDAGHSSILVHGDLLYVNTSNGVDNTHRKVRKPEAPSLVVLDKKTGKLLARDREDIGPRIFHNTWSSPSLGAVNGRELVFFGGGDGVMYAFDTLKPSPGADELQTLSRVWRFDCDPTAPKQDVHRFTGNRKESPSNIKGMPVFHDGRVYVAAGGDMWWGKNQSWLKCIDATKTGDITTSAEIWSCPLGVHCMSTPAIHDGLVYIADASGQVHCIDAATGKPYWVHQARGVIWASTLVADGKVYLGTQRGEFVILATGKEKKVLSVIDLGSPISGTAVAANGVVYVTTYTHLYALKKD